MLTTAVYLLIQLNGMHIDNVSHRFAGAGRFTFHESKWQKVRRASVDMVTIPVPGSGYNMADGTDNTHTHTHTQGAPEVELYTYSDTYKRKGAHGAVRHKEGVREREVIDELLILSSE